VKRRNTTAPQQQTLAIKEAIIGVPYERWKSENCNVFSAGSVGTYVLCLYICGMYHSQCACTVMEAENAITLTTYTSGHVFIALGWRSEMIMGFHEYTYQDREYIIRAMNTKHAVGFLQPTPHTAMLFHTLGVYTNPPPPVPPFLLTLNQSPKEIAGSDITNCLTHTMYAIAFKAA